MENLFNSMEEQKEIENLLAARKYKETKIEEKVFVDEIVENINKCDQVAKLEGAKVNYAAELTARKVENPESYINFSSEVDNKEVNIESLERDFFEFLKTTSRNNSEDIRFHYRVINDRLDRIAKLKERRQKIEEVFPELHNVDYSNLSPTLVSFFNAVDSFLPEMEKKIIEKPEVEKQPIFYDNIDLTVPKNPLYEVIGIRSSKKKENKVEEQPSLDEIFESGYEKQLDSMLSSLELEKEQQPFNLNKYDSEIVETEAPKTIEEKPLDHIMPVEALEELEEKKQQDLIKYKMPYGFSLVDIALELYRNADLWIDIYNANQDVFNDIVKEVRNNNFDNIENDKEIFSGLTINFPIPEMEKELVQAERVL